MKFLWTYLKKDWWLFTIAPILMAISVFSDLYLPTLMEKIIDSGILTKDTATIYTYGKLMLLITFLGLFCGGLSYLFSAKSSGKIGEKMRASLYQKLLTISYPELDHFGVASLITRMTNDISNVQNFLLSLQRNFISAPIMLFGGLFMSIYLTPSLSFIFYFAIPFTIGTIAIVSFKLAKTYSTVQKKIDDINKNVREKLLSIYVIKGFCREDASKKEFDEKNTALFDWQMKTANLMIILLPFLMIAFNYSMVAIMWFGGYQAASGTIAVGQIMAFLTYLSLILNAIITCSFLLITYARAKASINRLNEVIETPITIPLIGQKIPKHSSLLVKNLNFSYEKDGDNILKDISFEVNAGERLGIVGETGSGKSTLLYLLAHLYEATSGDIYFDTIPVSELSDKWLRNHLRFVEQDSTVLSGTIEENLRIAKPDASDEEMKKALMIAQANELLNADNRGLDGSLSQRGADLSGGQKQRLSIARAMLGEVSYLFLDDATSALDVLTERAFLDELDKIDNLTQIIVSQRISTLKRTDKILVLNQGRIEACGKHEELLQSSPTYLDILESQLGGAV